MPLLPKEPHEIGVLLRGEPEPIRSWLAHWTTRRLVLHVGVIIAGAGCYGAAMGAWRDPMQALYTAIKFPLILLLTTIGNALLNGMLAPLLGLNIGFRQSFYAILMSVTISAAILGSFSPIVGFLIWNAPPMTPDARISGETYAFILLAHVLVIAFAGTAAVLRLATVLRTLAANSGVAYRVLFAWLAGNLLFGSQLSWILRPFIGSPGLPVEFLRDSAFKGNFFEAVLRTIGQLITD